MEHRTCTSQKWLNDDLVMSFAIGAWLFDGASDYSKSNAGLNNAMLAAMSKSQRPYTDTSDQVYSPISVYGSANRKDNQNNVKQNLKNTKNRSNIKDDYLWVIK